MNYSLDSVKDVKECLAEKYKGHKITSRPIFTRLDLINKNEESNVFYFGLCSLSGEVYLNGDLVTPNIDFKNEINEDIISVNTNNQIIEFFHHFDCTLGEGLSTVEISPVGQFRGFEITIQGL